MSLLSYDGINASGQKVAGRYAGTKTDLLRELQSSGVILTNLKEEQEKLKGGHFAFSDLQATIEQLHYLLVAGLQIDQALGLVVKGSRKRTVRLFWTEVWTILKDGVPLSQSLKRAAKNQDCPMEEFYVNVIAVGEEVGDLTSALQNVKDYLEFKNNLLKEIRSALAYPIFLFAAGIVTMLLVVGLILPKFASIYTPEEIGRLPSISQVTMSVGQALNNNPYMFLIGLFIALMGGVVILGSPNLRILAATLVGRIPLVGGVVLNLDLARLFTSLGTMLRSGVDLSRAIRLSAKVVSGVGLRNILTETDDDLRKGLQLSASWQKHDLIPDDIVSLVIVGETGASLDDIFTRSGEKYMDFFKAKVSLLLTFLEPAIIIVLGIFIGFIVISIMLAVVSMSDLYG